MFTAKIDDRLLFTPLKDAYLLHQPKVELEANKASSFDFKIYPDHPEYKNILKFNPIIKVYDDNDLIFRGRILDDVKGWDNEKKVSCEGELSFFNDSIVRPYDFKGSVYDYLQLLVKQHNGQVDKRLQFTVRNVTVVDPNDLIVRANSNYPNTLQEINDKLFGLLGGYFYLEHDESKNITYLDYYEDPPFKVDQGIEQGKNLLDLTETIKGEDIATAIVPLGAKIEAEDGSDTGKRLTIASANNGKDYLYDEKQVQAFGYLYRTVIWDDVTTVEALMRNAKKELAKLIKPTYTLELKAFDLSLIDLSLDKFKILHYVKATSKYHTLDEDFLISKLTIDMESPENSTVTIGQTFSGISDSTNATHAAVINTQLTAQDAVNKAIYAIEAADGKNTNYYGNSGDGFPPKPKSGDLYFQKDGDKTTMYRWDGSSWVNLIDTSWQDDFEADLQNKLDQAKQETDAALAEKDKAINDLDKKVTDKITQTNTAVTQAQSDANAAKTQADAAVAKANSNTVTINAAKIDITKALNDSTSALNAIKLVDGRVDSVTTTIANVKSDVDKKADKTAVASQISQSATEIRQDLQSWTNGQLTNYSTIQSTATSIASAVSSKADKSQITQLSDQITSVVSSSGQNNLVYNSTFQDSIDGWRVQNGYKQTTARNIGGNYSIEFKLPENPNGSWNFARSKKVPIGVFKNYAYSVSIMRMVDIPNAGFFAYGVEGYDESGNRLEWKTVNIHSSLSDYVWVLLSDKFTFTNPDVKTVSFVFATNGYGHYLACQPIMVNDKNVGSFVPDGMNKSQITQLSDDINLRVIKGDVVNQINISPESILIAGNKVQITGETYIENGIIGNAKIKDLSASKLTAGTIDAAKINVLNINAANITTGILNADRIGANSINATHINVANLAAISADLGIITAGIINAATVRIINLDAGAISTGTLNANRIAAYSITADKIQATSLDLFNADFYTNVQADGMRMQGKAQIIFGKWKDSSGVVRNSEGLYIGGYNAGVKYVALTRADGSTFMLRANSDMDIGTNTNVAKESLNIYDTVHLWYPQINHSDLTLNGYFAMGGGIQEGSIQYDKNAGTMNFRVPGGRSGSYFWFNQNVNAAGTFNTVSRLSLKNVKGEYKGDALKEICDTNIVEYSYKNNPKARQLSPIIDDVNKIKQFTLPDIINDGKTVNLYAMSSLSWLAIQELAKKLENIEEK